MRTSAAGALAPLQPRWRPEPLVHQQPLALQRAWLDGVAAFACARARYYSSANAIYRNYYSRDSEHRFRSRGLVPALSGRTPRRQASARRHPSSRPLALGGCRPRVPALRLDVREAPLLPCGQRPHGKEHRDRQPCPMLLEKTQNLSREVRHKTCRCTRAGRRARGRGRDPICLPRTAAHGRDGRCPPPRDGDCSSRTAPAAWSSSSRRSAGFRSPRRGTPSASCPCRRRRCRRRPDLSLQPSAAMQRTSSSRATSVRRKRLSRRLGAAPLPRDTARRHDKAEQTHSEDNERRNPQIDHELPYSSAYRQRQE